MGSVLPYTVYRFSCLHYFDHEDDGLGGVVVGLGLFVGAGLLEGVQDGVEARLEKVYY